MPAAIFGFQVAIEARNIGVAYSPARMYILAVSILSPVQLVGQEGVLERNLSTLRFREAKIICLKQFRFVLKFC